VCVEGPRPNGGDGGRGRKKLKKGGSEDSSFLAELSRMAPNMAYFGPVKNKLPIFTVKYVENFFFYHMCVFMVIFFFFF
jgi:hypothetical protein